MALFFFLFKEVVLKRERVREGDPECKRPDRLKTARERGRERARRETPRAALAVSEFGFEQWSVKVHFLI